MKKTFRKVLASMLALSMLFTSSGMTTLAADAEDDAAVEETVEEPAQEAPAVETYSAPAVEEQKEAEPAAAEPAPAEEKSEAQASEAKADESAKADDSAKTEASAETNDSGTEAKADESAEKADSASADSDVKEEAAEEDEEEDEVTLVEQKLTATVKSGNAGIETMSASGAKITLEGKMPEGATVKAEPVDVEIEGIAILAAYDITIYDADGNEFEPEEGTIRVHIENAAIREAQKEDNDLFVYHMKTKNAEPEKVQVKEAEDGAVEFDAKEFSIYIVGEDDELYETDGETPHYVYKLSFYIEDDSNQPISTQTVSPGEYVEMPSVPDRTDYEFVGWYSEPNGGGDQYLDYSSVMPEITDEQDHEISLYAHYIELHYVHYMTQAHEEGDENTRVIFHSEAYTPDQTLDTSTAESLYLSEGYLSYVDETTGQIITELAVTGWQDADGTRWQTGDVINWDSIDGDLILYPIVEGAYWVYYDMNGHDSIENPEPEYVLASETYIGTLPEPEVSGYTFDGWYTAAEGGTRVTSTTTLESLPKNSDGSITLYAHWTETYVAYTINIWRQKAIDGAAGVNSKEITNGETYDDYIGYYDYAESHYVSADQSRLKTGETPTTSIVDNWSTYTGYGTTTNEDSAYYGFEYGTNSTARTRTLNNLSTITMAADGSTIINIFYNRVTISWTFSRSNTQGSSSTVTGTLIGLYDTNVTPSDGVPAGTLSEWPSAGTSSTGSSYIWQCSYGSGRNQGTQTYTFEAKFKILHESTSLTFTPTSWGRTSRYVYYYLEVTNEETQVDTNGEKAQEAASYGISYTKTVNSTPYVYARTLMVVSGLTIESKFVGYKYAGYNITDNGTTFTGNGDSIPTTGDQVFIFNDAITTNTITLISSDQVVGVDAAGDAITTTQEVTYPNGNIEYVKYGAAMSNYPFPETLDGETWGPAYYYHFVGWYEDPTFTAPFSIKTMPNNNVVAYADWELNDITVTFNTGTSDVEAPAAQKLQATQKATDPGTLEREGYTHVGWVDQNGKVFNFDTVLYADTTLTAIWKADDESGYTMLYDLNVDNSYGLFDGYTGDTTSVNGDHFTVDEELWTLEKAFPDLQGTDYEDAYSMFIGWNTAADGSGTMYYPDDDFTLEDVEIDSEGRVTLYAIWAHKNESTLILEYNYPEGYEHDDGETEIILTGDNLTAIDLEDTSGLEYHHEITVTIDGVTHTYRFDGWSTTTVGSNATDDDVDIAADATVAVDTLETSAETNANYLFAVWLEVHNITVTKEVVNDAVNYTVPDDQTFSFTWSFVDGEGVTNRNEETITIGDKETFIIPDVASGESVTITEDQATGFTTSYNGAHTDVEDDGNGTYTFTMDDNSQEITVYNTVETNKLTVNKVWQDANGNEETDVEHDAVTVMVYEDETSLGELTLSADNDWADSLEVVVKGDATYTVSEDPVDGYNTTVSEMTTDETTGDVGFTVTNTEIPYIDIEVTKEWVDDGNRDGLESNYVTVQLEIDQVATDPEQTLTLSKSNDWTDTFIGLPKYDDNGNEINYSVEETDVPEGYTATYTQTDNGWKITNTHEDYLVSEITITKTWNDADDQDGKRPESVKFELQVNGNTVNDNNGESWTVELTEENADENDPDTWTTTITDHPVYVYEEGTQISYTLHEDDVAEGYTTSDGTVTITPVYDDEDEENIVSYTGVVSVTNTHTPELYDEDGKLTVTKAWDDKNNQDGIRPASVNVTLSAVDSEGTEVTLPEGVTATQTITANDAWTATYKGLYKYSDGKEITYTVSETAVDGYTTTYDPASDDDEATGSGAITDGEVTITNTHTPETITVEGSKEWNDNDNQDGKRPDSITIRLMADGSPVTEKTVTAADDWKWSFTDLDKYSNGTEIVYTITENAVSDYTTTYGEGTYNVTNSYTPEETTVTVTKDWNDDDDRDGKRPSEVTVTLTGTNGSSRDLTLNDGNNWTTTVNVPMYYNNGQLVVYSVSESTVTGYDEPVITSTGGYNFVVTNTNTPELVNETGDITVTKTWNDNNNQDGKRDSYAVTLTGTITVDGATQIVSSDTQTLAADTTSYTWKNMPKYSAGEEISYSVTETTVPDGYEASYGGDLATGFTVTNTHTPEVYEEVTVTKVWVDDGNRDGLETETINAQLYAGETASGDVVELSATNSWTYTWENLPKYADGTEIVYSVQETEVPAGYTVAYSGDVENGFTITNTHEDYMVSELTITKVWDDADDQDGIRPKEVQVELQINGTTATDVDGSPWTETLTAADADANGNWVITVTDHPVYLDEEGHAISYTLHEDTVTDGYESTDGTVVVTEEDGKYTGAVTITNTHTPETVDVEGKKTWDYGDDPDTKPASITIHLLADGTEIDSATVTETEGWTWSFTDLPKYNSGKEITYTITEDAIQNYTTEIDGYNVTNTYNPNMTTVTVSKGWDDDFDRDGLRPNYVTVTLTGSTNSFSQDIVLNENNNWTATVDVPMYDNNGDLVEYTVSEEQVANYEEPAISSTSGTSDYNFIVTNKHTPATVDGKDGTITVQKVWDDENDQDGIRPENVTVTLYADDDVANVFTLNESNNWTDSVSGMYKYANGGQEITYTVTEAEISVPEGHTGYDDPTITGGADEENEYTFTVTNKHTPELVNETGEITVTKVWVDDDNRDGMETNIEVQLYANGSASGDPVSLTGEEDNWTYTWDENLPKYKDGEEIVYSVQEAGVPEGYTVAYSGDVESGFVITNTHESKTVSDLTITKVWDDADDQDGIRPASVIVELQIGGSTATDVDGNSWTATLTNEDVDADGNWTITVDDHPVYVDENGAEITYTLHEDTVTEGYESTDGTVEITTDDEGNYTGTATITNTHTPETVDVEGSKTWEYGDDPDEKPESITIHLLADGTEIDSVTVTEDEEWAWSFTDLPKYCDGGTEIVYTITEAAVENYTSEVNGYDVTNTYTPETTTVTVNKVWDDVDDKDGIRPDEVTVTVTGTNGFSEDMTLNEENSWTGTVDVPMYHNRGTEAEYSVTEEAVDGYNAEVTSSGDYNFTVTNKHDVTDWSVEKKLTNSGTGEGGAFKVGEVAEFTITVTNTGNTLIDQIEITEELEGATFIEDEGYTLNDEKTVAKITELDVGEEVLLYAQYEIEEKDLITQLVNRVTTTVDSRTPGPGGESPIPTEEPEGHLTVTKEITSEPANGEAYTYGEEIQYKITVTNDGNLMITDITVTDELTEDEWTIKSLAPGAKEEFTTSHKVTMDDVNAGSVTNEATVEGTSPDPDEPEVPSEPGEVETPTEEIDYFPMDEEIVPGNDDEANPGSWIDRESVNEYDAIEIEMSTTLPNVSGTTLAAGDFSMTFHNILDTQLVLDDLDSDFTVDINGEPIDHQYYEIDMIQSNSLLRFFNVTDGCTFHVNVDLSGLYNAGKISDEDLGTGTVRVFFYADLETTDVNGSYTSTAWYDLTDGDELLHTSEQTVVTVYTFEIIVNAVDKDTGAPLAGVEYGLYYDEDCTKPVTRNGEPYVVTTDENGQGMFVGIAEGPYYVKEIVKPDDYQSITEPMAVTLEGSEDSNHIFEITFPYVMAEPTKSADVDAGETVEVGDEITYTITYYNNYDEPAIVTIKDTLDKGVDFVSATNGGVYDEDNHTVTWTIENAAAGEEGSVQLTVRVNENAAGSELHNTAGVKVGNEAEVNTNTVGIPIEPETPTNPDTPQDPTKTSNVKAGASVNVGDEIIYTITYYNHNEDPTDVVIVDTLDAGLDFVSATEGGVYDKDAHAVTWTIADAAHGEGSVTLTLKVNEIAGKGGSVKNTASVKIGDDEAKETNTVGISVKEQSTGGTTGGTTGTGAPKTADTNRMDLWLLLLICSAGVAGVAYRKRYKRN